MAQKTTFCLMGRASSLAMIEERAKVFVTRSSRELVIIHEFK